MMTMTMMIIIIIIIILIIIYSQARKHMPYFLFTLMTLVNKVKFVI
jgi:hypothetical protein